MRISALSMALFALLLAACGRDPNVNNVTVRTSDVTHGGRWLIDRQTDRITGKPFSYTRIFSTRAATDDVDNTIVFPFPVVLELLCFRDVPTARLKFQYTVGTEKNSTLGWRFDDIPGKESEARILRDYKTVIIDQPAEMKPFLEQMVRSKKLYIRVLSLNNKRNSAEFDLDGAALAVDAAFANCPFPEPEPPPPPRNTRRKRTSA